MRREASRHLNITRRADILIRRLSAGDTDDADKESSR